MTAEQSLLRREPLRECRPLLKWAGGKTQLLGQIAARMPQDYGRYIEPFLGGGALFFALQPREAVIADSNPELVNLYRAVAQQVDEVIEQLRRYCNTEEMFYAVRAQDWQALPAAEAAARTLFLNRTCFNGLYRVNRQGQFNVPFGRYKNPRILDETLLRNASELLQRATLLCADYRQVLREHARPGDFVFLDPPYLPVSAFSDFKRYTKEQFHEADHHQLADEVERLHELGCHTVLTNSNHPLVDERYGHFALDVLPTKRNISSNGKGRQGEDVIVRIPPMPRFDTALMAQPLPEQALRYPTTRFMGSKNKLLSEIWSVACQFEFDTAIDLFAGTGVVGYLFKAQGKRVLSNDYMAMSAVFARAMIENNHVRLAREQALALLQPDAPSDGFVERQFRDLYFTDEDNRLIDTLRANIKAMLDPHAQAIAMTALIRACQKKRPRGIFTYVGQRYDDGRKDLQMSFADQFMEAVDAVNAAVFDNGHEHQAIQGDALQLEIGERGLVYIDPPYYSAHSDNAYVRRYHFLEGLARDWQGVAIQQETLTKKFKSYPTPFSSRLGTEQAFDQLFQRYRQHTLLVSYSSNSLPDRDSMLALMRRYKRRVEVVPVDYRYSFGNQKHKVGDNHNRVQEYLFIGY